MYYVRDYLSANQIYLGERGKIAHSPGLLISILNLTFFLLKVRIQLTYKVTSAMVFIWAAGSRDNADTGSYYVDIL